MRNMDMWRRSDQGIGGGTHLARVDLLTAEGVVVGTHVGGVGALPVVLVVGLSSRERILNALSGLLATCVRAIC